MNKVYYQSDKIPIPSTSNSTSDIEITNMTKNVYYVSGKKFSCLSLVGD